MAKHHNPKIMRTFFLKLRVFLISVIVVLSACKDDDPDSCQNGVFEMMFNGEHVTASSFDNTLLKGNSAGTNGKRMDIRATDADGRQLIITFTDLSDGTSGDGVSTDEYIPFSEVATGTENTFLITIIENDVSYFATDGNLDITSCDASEKQVSGTFSFSYEGFEVTNGSFSNMCYRVVQQ